MTFLQGLLVFIIVIAGIIIWDILLSGGDE